MIPFAPKPNTKQPVKSMILEIITIKSSISILYLITLNPLKILMIIAIITLKGSERDKSLMYIFNSGLS